MVLIPPLMRGAARMGALDLPNERKVHTEALPRVGGIAMVAGAVLPIILWVPLGPQAVGFLVGVAVLLVFGVMDDRLDLDYRWKLVGQLVAALAVVVYGGVVIDRLTFLGIETLPPWFAVPLTLFFIVGITNAINLSDGLDGLAGGTTLLTLGAVAVMAYLAGSSELVVMSFSVMGAILGFLRFNTHPARLFMGDTGSQFLGFSAGVLTILLTQEANAALSPVLPIMLLGLPILDTLTVMVQRIYEGRSPFSADKNHLHHRLLALGLDHYEAVTVIYLLMSALVAGAFLLRYESDGLILLVYLVFCAVLTGGLRLASARGWHLSEHRGQAPSTLARWVAYLRVTGLLHVGPVYVLRVAIPLVLFAGAMLPVSISPDFGVASLALLMAALVSMWRGWTPTNVGARAVIYIACAFAVYLLNTSPWGQGEYARYLDGYFLLLAPVIAIGIRFSDTEVFRVTPLDLLVILMALAVPSLPELNFHSLGAGRLALQLIVLFYGCEFLISRMRGSFSVLNVSTVLALGLMGMRGFL